MSTATGVVTRTARLTKEGSRKRHPPVGDKGLGSAQVPKRGRYWDQHLVGPQRRGAARLVKGEILAGCWRSGPALRSHGARRGMEPCLGAEEGSQAPRRGTRRRREGRKEGPCSTTHLENSKSTKELVGIRGREKV